jgi:ATP-dependent exoDNAse (exonuclease V) beta subunit
LFFEVINQYRLLSNEIVDLDINESISDGNYIDSIISYFAYIGIHIDFKKLELNNVTSVIYYLIDRFNLLNDKEGTEYMFKYLDILHDFVLNKSNSLVDFFAYYEQNKANFSIACPDHMNAITITSIHKSKGLEYPVVILPFTSWTHQADHEKIWFDISSVDYEELRLADRPSFPFHFGRINSKEILGFDSLETQSKVEKDAIFLDSINMLYVATTRAKQRLHILMAKPSDRAHAKSKTVFEQSVGQMFLEFVQQGYNLQNSTVGEDSLQLSESYFVLQGNLMQSKNAKMESEEIPNEWILLKAQLFDSPSFRINTSKSDLFTLAEAKRKKGEIMHQFLACFSGMSSLEKQLVHVDEEFQFELREILANPLIQNLFIDEDLLFVETDILCPDGSIVRPDRVILKDGNTVVVDFKTGIETESHRKQLTNYMKILSQMGYSNVQGVLLYLADQRLEYVY